jgi:hypothetical protein
MPSTMRASGDAEDGAAFRVGDGFDAYGGSSQSRPMPKRRHGLPPRNQRPDGSLSCLSSELVDSGPG